MDLSALCRSLCRDRFTPTYSFDINDHHQLMVYRAWRPERRLVPR
ncbi:hypothetical protein [Streptomyces yanii]